MKTDRTAKKQDISMLPLKCVKTKKALGTCEDRFRALVDTLPHGVQECDTAGKITFSNKAHHKMHGYEEGELEGRAIWDFLDTEEEREGLRQYLIKLVSEQPPPAPYFSKDRTKDGRLIDVQVDWNYKRDAQGAITGFISIIIDITERKQLQDALKKNATTDTLTQAFNRAKFEEIVDVEMERAMRYNHPLSMIIFDVDSYKEINDNYGHLVGDYALKTIANIVRNHMRKINHLIRWGGDEFVIIPIETGIEGAKVLSERIRQAIESFDFEEAGRITVSFGIALFDKNDTSDTFLKRADDALFKAKKAGGNCVMASV